MKRFYISYAANLIDDSHSNQRIVIHNCKTLREFVSLAKALSDDGKFRPGYLPNKKGLFFVGKCDNFPNGWMVEIYLDHPTYDKDVVSRVAASFYDF